jgi:hypothetical protein
MKKLWDNIKECIYDDDVECLSKYFSHINNYNDYFYFAAINDSYNVVKYFISMNKVNLDVVVDNIIFHYCENNDFYKLVKLFNIFETDTNIRNIIDRYMIEYLFEILVKNIGNGNKILMEYITEHFADVCYSEKSIILIFSNINKVKKIDMFYTYLENGNIDIDKYDLYENINNFVYNLFNYNVVDKGNMKEFLSNVFSLIKCNRKNLFKIQIIGMRYISSIFFKMLKDEYYDTFFYYFSSEGENLDYLKYYVSQISCSNSSIDFNYIVMGISRTSDDIVYNKVFNVLMAEQNFINIVLNKMDENENVITSKIINDIVKYYNLTGVEDLKIIKNLLL